MNRVMGKNADFRLTLIHSCLGLSMKGVIWTNDPFENSLRYQSEIPKMNDQNVYYNSS